MEQGTISTPNRFTFDRFTAKALWQPLGTPDPLSWFDLGNIDGHALDDGIKRETLALHIDGNDDQLFDEVVSVAPVWTLKGKQFFTTILPLLYMGNAGALATQAASGAGAQTLTATPGAVFDLGARGLSAIAAVDGAVTLLAGIDYFAEPNKGIFRFAEVPVNFAAGDPINVTWTQEEVDRETYQAYAALNSSGTLLLFMMDQHFGAPVVEARLPGTLSRDKGSEGDPTKTNQWALRFALEGTAPFLRLADWSELLDDDGEVIALD